MQILSTNQESTCMPVPIDAQQQLKTSYFLPKIPPLDSEHWSIRLLDSIEMPTSEWLYFFVRFQHVDDHVVNQFYIQKEQQQRQLIEIISDNQYAIRGSISEQQNAFSVIFQQFDDKLGFQYSSYLIFPQRSITAMNLNLGHPSLVPIKLNTQKQQVVKVIGMICEKTKDIKYKGQVLLEKHEQCVRYILMLENEQVHEYYTCFDYYQLYNFAIDDQEGALQFINKKFDQTLQIISNFNVITTSAKQIGPLIDEEHEISYLAYDKFAKELIVAHKITKEKQVAFKIRIYSLMEITIKKPMFKPLISFLTPNIPVYGYHINPFDDMLIDSKTCQIKYLALSALNSVVVITHTFAKKMFTYMFHVQTGSFLKLSADSLLGYLDTSGSHTRQTKEIVDSMQYASKASKFLQQTSQILPELTASYYQYYQTLYWKQLLNKLQPQIYVQSYSIIWIVPHFDGKSSVFMMRSLPFIPMELIFQQQIDFQKTDTFQRLVDFVNGDVEFYDADAAKNCLDDYQFIGPIKESLYFKIDAETIKTEVELPDEHCMPMNTDDVNDDLNKSNMSFSLMSSFMGNMNSSQNTSSMQLLTSKTEDDSGSMHSSRRFSGFLQRSSKTILKNQTEQVKLFTDRQTIPIFTTQECCLVLNTIKNIKNPLFLTPANGLYWQSQTFQVFKTTNNVFYLPELHKQVNQVLQKHETSNLSSIYDMVQFAMNQVFFSNYFFDEISCAFYSISVHPMQIIKNLKEAQSQNRLSLYMKYLSDLILQLSKMYQFQLGEFMNVIKTIFGVEMKQFIDSRINDNLSSSLTNHLVSGLLKFTDECISAQLMFSIVKLSEVVQKSLQIVTANVPQTIPLEFIFADYVFFHSQFQALGTTKNQALKLLQNPIYSDLSRDHPFSRPYTSSLYCLQQMLNLYLESDTLFLACLRTQTTDEISKISQMFEQLSFYKIFDRPVQQLIQTVKLSLTKPGDVKQQLNEQVSGIDLLTRMTQQLTRARRHFQDQLSKQQTYLSYLEANPLNATYTAAHLIEQCCVMELVGDVHHGNPLAEPLRARLPDWLQTIIASEFRTAGIAAQNPVGMSIQQLLDGEEALAYGAAPTVSDTAWLAMYKDIPEPFRLRQSPFKAALKELVKVSEPVMAADDRFLVRQLKEDVVDTVYYLNLEKSMNVIQEMQLAQRYETLCRITDTQSNDLEQFYAELVVTGKKFNIVCEKTDFRPACSPALRFRMRRQVSDTCSVDTSQITSPYIQSELTRRTLIRFAQSLNAVSIFQKYTKNSVQQVLEEAWFQGCDKMKIEDLFHTILQ